MARQLDDVAPMFPLGSVLVPHMLLPLQVFEARYRVLMEELVGQLPRPDDQRGWGDDPRFGVTMIERGHEVGGADVRAEVGTLATVVGAQLAEDGRWAVVAVGGERVRVIEWLEDDPYPRARLKLWPDEDERLSADVRRGLRTRHAEMLALLGELGVEATDQGPDWTDPPERLLWQVALASPLGSFDRYQLLDAPGTSERARRLSTQLDDQLALLRARLDP
ncbi:MAG: LON peptidase substrate-binding domain-containing protein [Microthrixaceae bacterium]